MDMTLVKRINDTFYWIATSKPFVKMAEMNAAGILTNPDITARVVEANALFEKVANELQTKLSKEFRAASIEARNCGGHSALVMNIQVPFEAFDTGSSPYNSSMIQGFKNLMDACKQEKASLSVSKKFDGSGFYLGIDPSLPYSGLTWKKPAFGMRLDLR
jgi:hypothetical protein